MSRLIGIGTQLAVDAGEHAVLVGPPLGELRQVVEDLLASWCGRCAGRTGGSGCRRRRSGRRRCRRYGAPVDRRAPARRAALASRSASTLPAKPAPTIKPIVHRSRLLRRSWRRTRSGRRSSPRAAVGDQLAHGGPGPVPGAVRRGAGRPAGEPGGPSAGPAAASQRVRRPRRGVGDLDQALARRRAAPRRGSAVETTGQAGGEELGRLGRADEPRRLVERERHQADVPARQVARQLGVALRRRASGCWRAAAGVAGIDLHHRADHHELPVRAERRDAADEARGPCARRSRRRSRGAGAGCAAWSAGSAPARRAPWRSGRRRSRDGKAWTLRVAVALGLVEAHAAGEDEIGAREQLPPRGPAAAAARRGRARARPCSRRRRDRPSRWLVKASAIGV